MWLKWLSSSSSSSSSSGRKLSIFCRISIMAIPQKQDGPPSANLVWIVETGNTIWRRGYEKFVIHIMRFSGRAEQATQIDQKWLEWIGKRDWHEIVVVVRRWSWCAVVWLVTKERAPGFSTKYFFIIYLFIWLCQVLLAACGIFSCGTQDLVLWPGIKPLPPALGVWSLSHGTTKEVPLLTYKISFV